MNKDVIYIFNVFERLLIRNNEHRMSFVWSYHSYSWCRAVTILSPRSIAYVGCSIILKIISFIWWYQINVVLSRSLRRVTNNEYGYK